MKFTRTQLFAGIALVAFLNTVHMIEAATARSGYCDQQARDYAADRSNIDGNMMRSGTLGALAGAILGGIIGGNDSVDNNTTGVKNADTAPSSGNWIENYRYAYNNCLNRNDSTRRIVNNNKKHETWSPAWYDYCYKKYRSFNADTGYYRTYSGKLRFCR